MSKYLLEFELQGLPKMTNELARGYWTKRVGEAKLWKQRVARAVMPFLPAQPLQKANLSLVRYSSREADFDGLVSSFKHIIDGLVESRILANDKKENIGTPKYEWLRASPRKGKISVRVEEIE